MSEYGEMPKKMLINIAAYEALARAALSPQPLDLFPRPQATLRQKLVRPFKRLRSSLAQTIHDQATKYGAECRETW